MKNVPIYIGEKLLGNYKKFREREFYCMHFSNVVIIPKVMFFRNSKFKMF